MGNPYNELGEAVDPRIDIWDRMLKDDNARALLEQGVAKIAPELVPNVKLGQTMEEKFAKMEADHKAEMAKRDADFENFKIQEQIAKKTNDLRAKGLSDENIKEIQTLMVAKGIADFDTAAEYYKGLVLPTKPINTESATPKFEDNLYPKDGKTPQERRAGFRANLHTVVDKLHAEGKI